SFSSAGLHVVSLKSPLSWRAIYLRLVLSLLRRLAPIGPPRRCSRNQSLIAREREPLTGGRKLARQDTHPFVFDDFTFVRRTGRGIRAPLCDGQAAQGRRLRA